VPPTGGMPRTAQPEQRACGLAEAGAGRPGAPAADGPAEVRGEAAGLLDDGQPLPTLPKLPTQGPIPDYGCSSSRMNTIRPPDLESADCAGTSFRAASVGRDPTALFGGLATWG